MTDEARPTPQPDQDGWSEPLPSRPRGRWRVTAAVALVVFVAWFFAGTVAILLPDRVREAQRLGQRSTFDQNAWIAEPRARLGMAEDLERTGRLSGLTKNELVRLLGPADGASTVGTEGVQVTLEYRLGSTIVPWPRDDVLLVSLLPDGKKVAGTRIGVPQNFTQRDWRLFPAYRAAMARSLIDHGVLSGLRRQGVTDLLGEPDSAPVGDAGSSLVYSLGGNLVLSLRLGPDGRLNEQGVYLRQ